MVGAFVLCECLCWQKVEIGEREELRIFSFEITKFDTNRVCRCVCLPACVWPSFHFLLCGLFLLIVCARMSRGWNKSSSMFSLGRVGAVVAEQ